MMEINIKQYLDDLFDGTPPTKRAVEMKEEMYRNMTDKYADLIASGHDPKTAVDLVIASVGDPRELLASVREKSEMSVTEKKRSALRIAIAVMLYIISPIPLIVLVLTGFTPVIGLIFLFLIVAIATGLLVYDHNAKGIYKAKDETMVEEFRAWSSENKRVKQTKDAVSSALWSLTVAIYLLLSFTSGRWSITWIVFIVAAGIEALINLFFTLKGRD